MGKQQGKWRNWIIFVPLFIVLITTIGIVTYLSGSLGVLPSANPRQAELIISPAPTSVGTPIARFGVVDPRLLNIIDSAPSNYSNSSQNSPLSILPVGMYLPRTGDTQFELAQPTPLPTPIPYPTSPPLPLPPLAVLPTLQPIPTEPITGQPVAERVIPFNGEECAPSGMPVEGILTQRFHRYHGGIDIGIPLNTPIIATHSGQVTYADWSDVGYGYLVIIQNSQFITYYAHNNSFNVASGDFVGRGSVIAFSGSTGNSSGPHLHYETRLNDIPVDPLSFETRGYISC